MTLTQRFEQALRAGVESTLGDLFGYAAFAGGAWLCFYVFFRTAFRRRRLSPHEPAPGQVRRELLHSLRSVAIFGLVTAAVVFAAYSGWTRLYGRIDAHGWWWFLLSLPVMVVMHDTYFYWTHRLMHHRLFYHAVHRTHHLSTSPTPWAAYAFSPVEAFVQAGIGPLIVFTIPVHPAAFALFMTWQIAFNVFGHCGYEILPRWFLRSRAGLLLNTVTHHAQHHEKFRANFSLYFNVWDRLMGTNHPHYEERFQQATGAGPHQSPDTLILPATSSASPPSSGDTLM